MKVRHLKSLLTGAVVLPGALLIGSVAQAQNLGINNDQLNITGNNFGGATPNIASTGIVDTVTGIPDQGDGLSVVNFGFTFEQSGVSDGTYTFAVGVMLDDENNQRRLEFKLPNVSITIGGGGTTLSGSVAGSQTINALGRNSGNTITAVATFQDDGSGLTFNGSGLSVNMNSILNLVQASTANFNTIINAINTEGHYYYYTVALKQLSGSTVQFGHDVPGTFTPFGCITGSSIFQLNSNQLASSFDNAYALQGLLSFTGSPGSFTTTPSAFNTSCTASGGGGGGSSTPTDSSVNEESTAITNTLNTITIPTTGEVGQGTVDTIVSVLTDTQTLGSTVEAGVTSGTVGNDTAIDFLSTTNSALDVAGSANQQGGAKVNANSISSTLTTMTSVITALSSSSTPLTSSQQTTLRTATTSTVTATTKVITPTTSPTDAKTLTQGVASVINATRKATPMDQSLLDQARSLTQTALQNTLSQIANSLNQPGVTFTDSATTKTLLRSNTQLLEDVLDTVSINLTSTVPLDQSSTSSTLQSAGMSSTRASALAANLAQFVNPTGVSYQTATGTVTAEDTIRNSIGSSSTTSVTTDSTTGLVSVTVDNNIFPVNVGQTSIVPESIPDGVTVLPDGSALSVSDGIASTLLPAPKDPVSFSSALSGIEADVTFNNKGKVTITDDSGLNFSGTFALEPPSSPVSSSSPSVSFSEPSGSPADPNYTYKVNYPDGTSQNIVPFVSNDNFFNSVKGLGLSVATNRGNGVMTIGSDNYKPDYFVSPLSSSDQSHLNANADSTGVSYIAEDVNGDGVTDYKVISSSGVQVVYGVP